MSKITVQELIEKNKARNNGVLKCYICSKPLDENVRKTYVKEHKNNNRHDNTPGNLDIACRPCNKKKDPSRIITYLRSSELTLPVYIYARKERETLAVGSVAMKKNQIGKPAVLKWLKEKLSKVPALVYDKNFLRSAGKIGDVNPSTAEVWLDCETSEEGDYRIRTVEKIIDGSKVKTDYIMTKKSAIEFDKDNQV